LQGFQLRKINESGLLGYLNDICLPDVIILFGSYSKGEDILSSDIDLFILSKYENILNLKIDVFFSDSFGKLSKELKNNLVNGVILDEYLKVF